jgi:hypothetical protein
MLKYDCSDYNSEKCPKKNMLIKNKIRSDTLNVVMVGCWGVYCWNGEVDMEEYNAPENDELPTIDKIFERTTEKYGQKSVVNGIIKYAKANQTDVLFLAGDNVYNYKIPKRTLVKLVNEALEEKNGKLLPSKAEYKTNVKYSGQQIYKQLSDGFTKCMKKIPTTTDIFLGIGNHDVQNCFDLNAQLNYHRTNPRYKLPGTYYNVVYNMSNFSVNFIVIDTNMFSEKFTCDGKTKYTDKDKETQMNWVLKTLKKNKCEFNIIIGHVPYKANGHKEKNKTIYNEHLERLFTRILEEEKCPKVQVYMCADEHNQQFLYDKTKNMGLVIAGSGGTALDTKIVKGDFDKDVLHRDPVFGFVGFNFSKDFVDIQYHRSEIEERGKTDIPTYNTRLDVNGYLM